MKKAKDLIIIGEQSTVIDKLIDFIDTVGPFGTLLITGHDFGNLQLKIYFGIIF